MLTLAPLWVVKLELMTSYLPFLLPLCEWRFRSLLCGSAARWRCVVNQATHRGDVSQLAELMFPYLKKQIETGLSWAAVIRFSAVPCLDSVDFYACWTPALVSHNNWRQNAIAPKQNVAPESWLHYYTTLTNLALSSIERPELSFDFGCWTRGGAIFGIFVVIGWNFWAKQSVIGWSSCQLALPLPISHCHWFITNIFCPIETRVALVIIPCVRRRIMGRAEQVFK